MKATDILAMLQSFLRKGQRIARVTVYPSDYGLERMAEEARFGPKGLTQPRSTSQPGVDKHAAGQSSRKSGFSLAKEERAALLKALNEQDTDDEGTSTDFTSTYSAQKDNSMQAMPA